MAAADDVGIVCFANDWAADPTSKHHLMARLADQRRVLWVEAAGMRRPNLVSRSDLGRAMGKLRSFVRRPRQQRPGLWTYTPPSVPLRSGWAERANRGLYQLGIRRQLARLGLGSPPILWVYGPHVAPWIRGVPRRRLVYHCVDRWGEFENYDRTWMEACERELCGEADLVLASAADLTEHCRGLGADAHYIPHGVEHGHFAQALEDGPMASELESIAPPRVGFFGLIHEWVDTELIGALADRTPYSYVLLGSSNQDLSELSARPNVHVVGRRPYADLPTWCRGFDVGVVPFRMSGLTRSVNPIKLREYAAAGLPVVASDLPEIRRCEDIAFRADTLEDWVEALDRAVRLGGDPLERQRQSERVEDQDWDAVVERILQMIAES